ncbi:unnamed protein product [Amoebophrya sp. A120]|nr:unnamed protein product [Amoebophrya sp. A120]|eukprot:GSA120T00011552001.1
MAVEITETGRVVSSGSSVSLSSWSAFLPGLRSTSGEVGSPSRGAVSSSFPRPRQPAENYEKARVDGMETSFIASASRRWISGNGTRIRSSAASQSLPTRMARRLRHRKNKERSRWHSDVAKPAPSELKTVQLKFVVDPAAATTRNVNEQEPEPDKAVFPIVTRARSALARLAGHAAITGKEIAPVLRTCSTRQRKRCKRTQKTSTFPSLRSFWITTVVTVSAFLSEDPCGLFGDSAFEDADEFYECAARFLVSHEDTLRKTRDYGLAGGYKATIQRLWYLRRDDLAEKIFNQAKAKKGLTWPSVYWTPTVFFEEADQGSTGLYDCERAWDGDSISNFAWPSGPSGKGGRDGKGKGVQKSSATGKEKSVGASLVSSHTTALPRTLPQLLKENFSALKKEYMSVPRSLFQPAFSYLDRDGSWEVLWVYRKSRWENEELCAQYLPGLCALLKQVLPSPEASDYPSVRCRFLGLKGKECDKKVRKSADSSMQKLLNSRAEALDNTEEVLFLRMQGSARTSPHCGRSNSQVNLHLTLETPQSSSSKALLTVGEESVEQVAGSMYCFNDGMRHIAEFTNPEKTGVRTVLVIRVTKFQAKSAAISATESVRQATLPASTDVNTRAAGSSWVDEASGRTDEL